MTNFFLRIVIGICDPQEKIGHLYFLGPLDDASDIEKTLKKARKAYEDVSRLHIVAVGAADIGYSDPVVADVASIQQDDVETALDKIFPGAVIRKNWLSPDVSADLYLDLSLGEFMIREA